MQEIRVAVVGCGYVADGHLRAWRRVREAKLIAVSDLNADLAKNTAVRWNIPRYYKSLSEVLSSEKINVVDLCTPPQTHKQLANQAMEAGVNVIIEKPMTMTVKDAEEIVDCWKATGVKAGVIHNWLFDGPILQMDSMVRQGYLGDVLNVEVEAINTRFDSMAANERHWCHSLPGGRFSEMLAHPIYLIRHFLRNEVEIQAVEVSKNGEYPWMRSDELCAIFRAGDRLGRAYASFNGSREAILVSLFGEDSILKADIINSTVSVLPRMKTTRFNRGFDSLRQSFQLLKSTARNGLSIASGQWMSGHDRCIGLFAESLVKDKDPPVSVKDGLSVIATLEKACAMIERIE